MQVISDHTAPIKNLCNQHMVKSLFAFGSVTINRFKTESDIDLVVNIDAPYPLEYTDHYFELKFQLKQILQREVDLLVQKAIRNPFLKQEIDRIKVLIY